MADYKPSAPFNIPLMLLIPEHKRIKGVTKKIFPEEGEIIYCSFKTYGGTETTVNDVYSVVDTANIETWFRPDIKSDCAIKTQDGRVYEIIGEPENINLRNQYLKFKVQRSKGGA